MKGWDFLRNLKNSLTGLGTSPYGILLLAHNAERYYRKYYNDRVFAIVFLKVYFE
jgi:hypothetical protein